MHSKRLGFWGPALAAALTLLANCGSSFATETCSDGSVTTSGCDGLAWLAQDLMQRRVDRTIATDPTGDRFRRLNASSAAGTATSPFAITTDSDNANFDTSLTQWGAALTDADQEVLKEARKALGDDASLPKAAKLPAPRFDLWAQGRRESFTDNGSVTKEGSAFTTYLGGDYRWHRTLLVGGMVQLDDSRQSILAVPDAAGGQAFMVGPYLAYQITPNVTFDARAAWGTSHDSAVAGTDMTSFATGRMLGEATLSGNWSFDHWQLSQTGAITYLDETSANIAGAQTPAVDTARLSVGPRLKRHIDIDNDNSIEPFAFFTSSLNLADAGSTSPVAQNTVGGGITFAKPQRYNISATADYTESTAGTDGVATGKVSVKLPSSLVGF
jgi:hypothetical protein